MDLTTKVLTMRSTPYLISLVAILALFVTSTGCDSRQGVDGQQPVAMSGPPPASEHGHGHGDEHQGPHNGHVIELGRNHQYHAEIVENDAQQLITVYILGKDMKERPVDATMLTMSFMVEGAPRTFELGAANANSGTASRFDVADTTLFEALHEHEASAKLRVTINGAPYVANVEHHDHDDGHDDEHGHDHDDHGHGDGHNH